MQADGRVEHGVPLRELDGGLGGRQMPLVEVQVGGGRIDVAGQPPDAGERHVAGGQDAEGAADDHAQEGLALREPAPGHDGRRGDGIEAHEEDLAGLVLRHEVGLGHAVAGEVDGTRPEAVPAAEPQARQRAGCRGELRHEGEVVRRPGLHGADVVAGVVDDRLARTLRRQAPALPPEHCLVQVEVGVGLPGDGGGGGALATASVRW